MKHMVPMCSPSSRIHAAAFKRPGGWATLASVPCMPVYPMVSGTLHRTPDRYDKTDLQSTGALRLECRQQPATESRFDLETLTLVATDEALCLLVPDHPLVVWVPLDLASQTGGDARQVACG